MRRSTVFFFIAAANRDSPYVIFLSLLFSPFFVSPDHLILVFDRGAICRTRFLHPVPYVHTYDTYTYMLCLYIRTHAQAHIRGYVCSVLSSFFSRRPDITHRWFAITVTYRSLSSFLATPGSSFDAFDAPTFRLASLPFLLLFFFLFCFIHSSLFYFRLFQRFYFHGIWFKSIGKVIFTVKNE